MLKKINNKAGVILVSATLILSIFAFMLMNGSAAWFADSHDVQANGFSVNVNTDVSVTATLESYPVTQIDEQTGVYTLSKNEQSYVLPIYDEAGISYNETSFRRALVVIINIESHSACNITVNLTHSSDEADLEGSLSALDNNKISNVVSITEATLNDTTATKNAQGKSFVSIATDPETGTSSAQKTDIITLKQEALGQQTKQYCFIIEYNERLIDYIGEKIMTLNPDKFEITFLNDIEFQIFD